jgi:ribosome-binding factor A
MGQRVIRVNELLKREISQVLHTRFRGSSTAITIVEVDTVPNLRKARVFYSVVGDDIQKAEARNFFRRHGHEIQREMLRTIVLKYSPQLEFVYHEGMEHTDRLNKIFDELGLPDEPDEPNLGAN